MADAGRILIMPRGTYDASVSYGRLDLVQHNNAIWLAKKESIGIEPSEENSEYWFFMMKTDANSLGGKSAEEWQAEIDNVLDEATQVFNDIINGTQTVGNAETVDGYHVTEIGTSGARNLLPYPYSQSTTTSNGITFTDNGDGTITANGTATDTGIFAFKSINTTNDLKLRSGTYTISGASDNINTIAVALYNGSTLVKSISTSTFTISEEESAYSVRVYARVASGQTVTDLVFKPMLEMGMIAHDYVPYNLEGFLPRTGGTLEHANATLLTLNNTHDTSNDVWIDLKNKGERRGLLGFSGKTLMLYNPGSFSYKIHHTGNKPSGSYTGNGSSVSRNIEINGIGGALLIMGSNDTIAFVTASCGFTIGSSVGKLVYADGHYHANTGILTLSTTHTALNANGVTYTYYNM